MCGLGLLFSIIAAVLGAQEIAALPLACTGIGLMIGLYWLIATLFAWVMRIVVSDTSESAMWSCA
jgi:prepilin signal peptidase PulO-like enzyme (type II secretory pathway)